MKLATGEQRLSCQLNLLASLQMFKRKVCSSPRDKGGINHAMNLRGRIISLPRRWNSKSLSWPSSLNAFFQPPLRGFKKATFNSISSPSTKCFYRHLGPSSVLLKCRLLGLITFLLHWVWKSCQKSRYCQVKRPMKRAKKITLTLLHVWDLKLIAQLVTQFAVKLQHSCWPKYAMPLKYSTRYSCQERQSKVWSQQQLDDRRCKICLMAHSFFHHVPTGS